MITTIPVGPIGTNCYIYQYAPGVCLIVDPGADWQKLASFVQDHKLHAEAIIYTHGHWDHVLACTKLKEALGASSTPGSAGVTAGQTGAPASNLTTTSPTSTVAPATATTPANIPVLAHSAEAPLFTKDAILPMVTLMKRWGVYPLYTNEGIDPTKPQQPTQWVADGETIAGDLTIIHTPGHTPGGICLYNKKQGILFSGDTLFQGSRGRSDFPGGNEAELMASLTKLCKLPEDTVVYPGHSGTTTIGAERPLYS